MSARRERKSITPDSSGGPGQQAAAEVMKEPLSSPSLTAKTREQKIAQRYAIAQDKGRREAAKAAARTRSRQ